MDYARENQSVILYDAAYEAFIKEEGVPHSIYEIEGAMEVAIEFEVFPRLLVLLGPGVHIPSFLKGGGHTRQGTIVSLNQLWNREADYKI